MSLYVVAYDISHDGQRERVARALLEFGRRVQKSVFEVWLEPHTIPLFRRRIGPLLAREDRFDVFPIDERGKRRRFSWQRPPHAYAPVMLV
jgi:CRISPR-associated protein Cas2